MNEYLVIDFPPRQEHVFLIFKIIWPYLTVATLLLISIKKMDIIQTLLHSVPVVVGIALVAIALGGRYPLITGIVLIVLGLLVR